MDQCAPHTRPGITARHAMLASLCGGLVLMSGCKSPTEYRAQADRVAEDILTPAWEDAIGQAQDGFTI